MRLLRGQDVLGEDGEWVSYEPSVWDSVRRWWGRLWWPLTRHRHNRKAVDGIMANLETKLAEGYGNAAPIWQRWDYSTVYGVGVSAVSDTKKWRFAARLDRRSTELDFLAVCADLCGRLGYGLYPCNPPKASPGMLIDLSKIKGALK